MKSSEEITERTFELFAAKHYSNTRCLDVSEFHEDLTRFKYVKRLLRRYHQNGNLQERLILNHITIISNMFGIEPASRMLFFRIEEELWPALKTFLVYLNYLPESHKIEVPLDQNIVKVLRNL